MNIKELNERADMRELCELLNIKMFRRGATYFVHCPIPGHNDVHPTNCFFKEGDSYMYCTVCQKGINAVHLIMYRENLDYIDAAKKLAEFEGVEWVERRRPANNGYGISAREAEAIGLNLSQRIVHPVRQATFKEEQKLPSGYEYDPQFDDSYVYGKTEYAEDMIQGRILAELVANASQEKLKELNERKELMAACGLNTKTVDGRIYMISRIYNKARYFAGKRRPGN